MTQASEAPKSRRLFGDIGWLTNNTFFASRWPSILVGSEAIANRFRIKTDAGIAGPMSGAVISSLLASGGLSRDALVQREGTDAWLPLLEVEEFVAAATTGAATAPAVSASYAAELGLGGAARHIMQVSQLGQTGWLRAATDDGTRMVAFRVGRPVAVYSTYPDESDEAILLEEMRVSEAQVARARTFAVQNNLTVITALVETQAIAGSAVAGILSDNALVRLAALMVEQQSVLRFEVDAGAANETTSFDGDAISTCRAALEEVEDKALLLKILGGSPGTVTAEPHEPPAALLDEEVALLAGMAEAETTIEKAAAGLEIGALRHLLALHALGQIRLGAKAPTFVTGEQGLSSAPPPAAEAAVSVPPLSSPSAREPPTFLVPSPIVRPAAAPIGLPGEVAKSARPAPAVAVDDDDDIQREITRRAKAMNLDDSAYSVRIALAAEVISEEVGRRLEKGDFDGLESLVDQHLELAPDDPDAEANYALVMIRIAPAADQPGILARINKIAMATPNSLILQLALAEVAAVAQDVRLLKRGLRGAESLAPSDRRLHRLRTVASDLAAPHDKKAKGGTLLIQSSGLQALGIFAATSALLWLLACALGLGHEAARWQPSAPFWWIRRGILIAAALVGYKICSGKSAGQFFSSLALKVSPGSIAAAVVIGIGSGLLSPLWNIPTSIGLLLVMVLLHVIAEQLFFTGFLLRSLLSTFPRPLEAVLLTATAYGLYHLTFTTFFFGIKPLWIPYWILTIIIGGGLPYALLYARTRSLLPTLVCHSLVMGTVMFLSAQ